MDNCNILLNEYNNLWNEKLVHKQSIRKFHNYLTYITAVGSLALTFHGISAQDFFKIGIDQASTKYLIDNAESIINIFFVTFTPIVLVTLTFPLNDIYHIYIMGSRIGSLEKKINMFSGGEKLLMWEHAVCPVAYGNKEQTVNNSKIKLTNIISLGDVLLLGPVLFALCVFATIKSAFFIFSKVNCLAMLGYVLLVVYMIASIAFLALKVKSYAKGDGAIVQVIHALDADDSNKQIK